MPIKENEVYSEIIISTKASHKIQKYVVECIEKMKLGKVKIIGKQYAITKAFSVLEVLKEQVSQLEYYIKYNNLTVTGPDRRKLLEINIYVSLKN
ncbi:conserved Plasmodium protein, unknown function [Plasmodium gallinaceum]|uniref:DNA/RNA-binding protein Alba-like domain-containing protein n=1 Tax=Plasmodium gallinaceum TaxID=5849 RepID=A0A1J1GY96_PLAGA|nr:conserved Plasmodium protein, unknown function [Plasmodium gallinaceum]CRG95976.1 conserved Plasmodium protein, unknown function [Plasmodium gallinaceum]